MLRQKEAAGLLALFYAVLIAYMVINTGIISDDYEPITHLKDKSFSEILIPKDIRYFIETPLQYYTHFVWYRFFSIEHPAFANGIKILYIVISFYLISLFFSLYMNRATSYLTSFLFLFYPSHDATTFWFMGQYLTLSIALYLFAFYLAHRGKYAAAFLSASTASFICYGSTPVAVALFLLFLLNLRFKEAAVIIIPNIIYVVYFAVLSLVTPASGGRIDAHLTTGAFIKQYILQILTFFDAAIGPSLWLKIWYALPQISSISAVIAVLVLAVLWEKKRKEDGCLDKKLSISLLVMLLLALGMFAVSGRYPQMAFNLGNRVTIYGSLFIAYLIVMLPMSRIVRNALVAVMVFSAFGISDHWKAWSAHQDGVIDSIKKNSNLKNSTDKSTIYVSGNQYSRYGPLNHIEFFSEGFVVAFVFKYVFGQWVPVYTINKRIKYINGCLVDTKYDQKIKADGYIDVYDSEKNLLLKVKAENINSYIENLPPDNRHWIQLIKNKRIKDAILRLMPRLEYVFGAL